MIAFPTIQIIVGIPGSGKTTYCKEQLNKSKRFVHISSDNIRKEILGTEQDQSDNNAVFSIMQERTLSALQKGQSVLYDATNLTRKDRLKIISACPAYVQKEAIICWAPIEICIKRDLNRNRTVGKDIIDKMLKRFQAPFFDEGFDRIFVKKPDDWSDKEMEKYCYELFKKDINQDNPHHTLSLQKHMQTAYEYLIANHVNDIEILSAACWHDIGKLYTKTFINTKGEKTDVAHYYGHQGYSAWISYGFNASNIVTIAWLISTHMDLYQDNNRYVKQLPIFLRNELELLHQADIHAH